MPWKNIKEAQDAGMKTVLHDINLTIEQVNQIAAMADAIGKNKGIKEPYAVAVAQWQKGHEIKGDKWVEKSDHVLDIKLKSADYTLEDAAGFAILHNLGDVEPIERHGEIIFYRKANGEPETFNIPDVEIFKAGKWTDSAGKTESYSDKDIVKMAEDTNKLYTEGKFTGPVKLGHNEDQKLAKSDELPAVGWLKNLKAKVDERGVMGLYADLMDVPKKVYEIIKAKAYAKRSAEIFHDVKPNGGTDDNTYKHVIGGLALLGATLPAITSLDDIRALYRSGHDLIMASISVYGTPIKDIAVSHYEIDSERSYSKNTEANDDVKNVFTKGGENMTPEQQDAIIKKYEEFVKKHGELAACGTKLEDYEDMKSKLEDMKKSKNESDEKAKKFEADLEDMKKGKHESDEKTAKLSADLDVLKKSAYEAEKKSFFEANAGKFVPAEEKDLSDLYDMKHDKGEEDFAAFKTTFSARPAHAALSQYGKESGSEQSKTYAAKKAEAVEHCKKHGLDPDNASSFAQAMIEVGYTG